MVKLSSEIVSVAVITAAAQRDISPFDIADTSQRGALGSVRVAVCLALADWQGVQARHVGVALGYFDTNRQADRVISRYRRSPDTLELMTLCLKACDRGRVSSGDRKRVADRLRRVREAGAMLERVADPDRDIVADFLAKKGVTVCPPGSALGVSVLEQQMGVTGFPKGEVWRRSGVSRGR